PKRLKPKTARRIARPGKIASHGACSRKARPVLERIKPHDGVGGWVPTPRNESVASIRIALPSQIEAMTRIGAVTLGRMWVMMIRGWRHLLAYAASTYRFFFAESSAPRTMGELPGRFL